MPSNIVPLPVPHINSSGGAEVAFKLLNARVKWKRMLVGAHVFPIVVPGRRLHSKKFNKFGPNLIVIDYRDLSHGMPAEEAPRQLEQQQARQLEPVKQIGKLVREPKWAEILDDDLPDELKSAPNEQAKPVPAKQAKPKKTAAGGNK